CRLDGPSDIEITGVAGLEDAQPGQITFLANKRYTPPLKTTRASAVFVDNAASVSRDPGAPPPALVRSDNPYLAFAKALDLFYQPPFSKTTSKFSPTAASTAPPSAKRASDAAPKSTTSSSSATLATSGPTPCSAAKLASPVPPPPVAASSSPDKPRAPAISTSAKAPSSPQKVRCPVTLRQTPFSPARPPSTINCG